VLTHQRYQIGFGSSGLVRVDMVTDAVCYRQEIPPLVEFYHLNRGLVGMAFAVVVGFVQSDLYRTIFSLRALGVQRHDEVEIILLVVVDNESLLLALENVLLVPLWHPVTIVSKQSLQLKIVVVVKTNTSDLCPQNSVD
jgi:hypothetical protein